MLRHMKLTAGLFVVAFCLCMAFAPAVQAEPKWRLGMQAYSFNRFTFYEAVQKNKALGMRYIEAYPGQTLSAAHGDVKMGVDLSPALRLEVTQMLKDMGVRLVNFGVVGLPNNEQECRKVFNFARDMGIETIVSEPPEDAFDLIERLCEEYKIAVAIHNHPKPSPYWNPDTVLKVCEGRSHWIGACADTGHWTRSGVDPVEAVTKLRGRIVSLHFKDLNEFGVGSAHDVPWGSGVSKADEVLLELARTGFEGSFSIEYEHNWLNSMPEIALCVDYFERKASELGVSEWQYAFNGKDLTGWKYDERLWTVKDGAIRGETTPDKPAKSNTFCIWEAGGRLKDFELKLEFRIQNGNSGVQYRSKEFGPLRITGYQAEVENNPGKVGFLYHEAGRGSLVNVGDMMLIDEAGSKEVIGNVSEQKGLIEAGYYIEKDWNEYHIICQGNHVKHYLNGYQTIELIDNDRVTNPEDPEDRNGAIREGILALQIHTGPPMVVEFKDVRVKRLCGATYGDAQLAFNGKDLSQWAFQNPASKSKWKVGKAALSSDNPKQLVAGDGKGELINLAAEHGDSVDIYTKEKFGDCRIEVEVMVPQGSNSGIYVMGEYEIQVLDSYNRARMNNGDMGAIYGANPPPVNASLKPGQWQQYVIEFLAPRFDAQGNKVQNAKFLKVELNGYLLHKDLEMPKQTPGGVRGQEAERGPLMFQGNHGPVAYRNIVITPLRREVYVGAD